MLAGVGAGVLTALSGSHPAQAVLVGGAAAVGAAAFFNWAIARH
ncbi:hypothetical protein [Saccharothrix sp. NRRL B-16348]|nr:hypothetical protein [Saccharothrix sp. NRRL B-16348]